MSESGADPRAEFLTDVWLVASTLALSCTAPGFTIKKVKLIPVFNSQAGGRQGTWIKLVRNKAIPPKDFLDGTSVVVPDALGIMPGLVYFDTMIVEPSGSLTIITTPPKTTTPPK